MAPWRTPGVATVAWCLARLLLGNRWEGVEVAPGVWQDGVSLTAWATCWLALAALAAVSAGWIASWWRRLLALAPTLAWLAWALWSSLGPIPWVFYGVPTVAAWLGGWVVGDVSLRLVRPRQHPAP